jgi:hypothetical protein
VRADSAICLLASLLLLVARSLFQSLPSTVSSAGPRGHPLQRWPVLPHCQRTGCSFLRFSVGRVHFGTDAVGVCLTGTSSWPSRSTRRPMSTDASYARRISNPRMKPSAISRRTPNSSECAAPWLALRAPPSWLVSFRRMPFVTRTAGSALAQAAPRRCLV